MLHEYNAREIEKCLDCKTLLFIGDSTIRQLFWATALKANRTQAEHARLYAGKHGHLHFEVGCGRLEFVWDPYLNTTRLHEELTAHNVAQYTRNSSSNSSTLNAAIIAGGGLWHARHLGKEYFVQFKQNMDQILAFTQNPWNLGSATTEREKDNLLLFTPVQPPDFAKLPDPQNLTMAPDRISSMNEYLFQLGDNLDVLWSYQAMSRLGQEAAHEEDGVHLQPNLVTRQVDILLNLLCNRTPGLQKYPFDKTCCAGGPSINIVQIGMLVSALGTSSYLYFAQRSMGPRQAGRAILLGMDRPSIGSTYKQRLIAFIVFTSAVVYCFFADRTFLFEKMQKTTDQQGFLLAVGFVMILGFLTLSRPTVNSRTTEKGSPSRTMGDVYLSRNQTEEWKGWMQVVILLYHYFGMSKVLWAYQLIRLLVASYLFLTGFGHTIFFLKTDDFAWRRLAMVLVRLNILSVTLAYAMNTDYDFYYFPALSSFWFLIVCLTLRWQVSTVAGQKRPVVNIIFSGILVRTAVLYPGALEMVVHALHSYCHMHVDLRELRFRTSLDMYIVYAGMLSAILYSELSSASTSSSSWLASQICKRPFISQMLAVVSSLVAVMTFIVVVGRFSDKYAYNKWHPLISSLPVLAYVVLRNATAPLRSYHSRLFAWFGRCSLETFILQYHIWLAADTKGLLRLGLLGESTPNGFGRYIDSMRWLEFFIITAFFLWTSWGVSDATNVLTRWLVGPPTSRSQISSPNGGPSLRLKAGFVMGLMFLGNWMWPQVEL